MIQIEANGRVRIVGQKSERVVSFADREAELRLARVLASAVVGSEEVEVIPSDHAVILINKRPRATKRPEFQPTDSGGPTGR